MSCNCDTTQKTKFTGKSALFIILLSIFLVVAIFLLVIGYAIIWKLDERVDKLVQYEVQVKRIEKITKIMSTYPLYGIEPYVYAVTFDTLSRKYGIDWEAIAATIDIETGRTWLPTQKSSAACKGIMQMKESTAEMEANKQGIPYHKDTTVWMEIRAIDLGSSYLSKGLKEHKYKEGFKYYY